MFPLLLLLLSARLLMLRLLLLRLLLLRLLLVVEAGRCRHVVLHHRQRPRAPVPLALQILLRQQGKRVSTMSAPAPASVKLTADSTAGPRSYCRAKC